MEFHNHSPKTAFKKLCETTLPTKYLKRIEQNVGPKDVERINHRRNTGDDDDKRKNFKKSKLSRRLRRSHFGAVCKATTEYIKNLEKVLLTVLDEKIPKNHNPKSSIPMDICQVTDMLFPGFQRQVLKSAVEGEVSGELQRLCCATSNQADDVRLEADRALLKHLAQMNYKESSQTISTNISDELMWTLQQLSEPCAVSGTSTGLMTTSLNSHTQTSPSDFSSHRLRHFSGGGIVYQQQQGEASSEQCDDVSVVSTTTVATSSICTSWASNTTHTAVSASSASTPALHYAMADFSRRDDGSSTLCVYDTSLYGVLLDEAARCPPASSFQEFDAFVGIDRPDLELPLEDIDV